MDRARAGAALLLVGLLVAAHPLYLGLNPGDTTVAVTAEPADDVAESQVTNATTLDAPARETLREAVEDDRATRWRGAERDAVRPLIRADHVRLDGQVYRVRVLTEGSLFDRVDTVVSPLVALVGVLGAFVGSRTVWDELGGGDDPAPR